MLTVVEWVEMEVRRHHRLRETVIKRVIKGSETVENAEEDLNLINCSIAILTELNQISFLESITKEEILEGWLKSKTQFEKINKLNGTGFEMHIEALENIIEEFKYYCIID